jgi:DNA (cytosine-5)-methyltransferase 1
MKHQPIDPSRSFKVQYGLNFTDEIIIDLFAGGGGASTGLEIGLNRTVYSAINHNPKAISMHTANHPHTRHFVQDVFAVDPLEATGGQSVGWMHASPDCTHHSQAAGGQPRSKEIRDLSWVAVKFAGKVRPRVISLENVKQILNWGPLVAKRCKKTGRVMRLDGSVAAPGEHTPRHDQFLVPDPTRKGQTWAHFVSSLESLGYVVEWRVLRACDYGAPTTRERLFMVARCDGQPIVWPEPTHAQKPQKGQKKWRSAAECIDFADLGQSIFGRKKPLAEATQRRIAKGLKRFVLDAAQPYIVTNTTGSNPKPVTDPLATVTAAGNQILATPVLAPFVGRDFRTGVGHSITDPLATVTASAGGGHSSLITPLLIQAGHGEGTPDKPRWSHGINDIDSPLGTITASGGGGRSLVAPVIVKFRHDSIGQSITDPLPTITAGGNSQRPAGSPHALGIASAYMMQCNGGFNATVGKDLRDPLTTVTNTGSQQQLVTAVFTQAFYGQKTQNENRAADLDSPLRTITTENRHGLVSATLSKDHLDGALRVAAFLVNYYGNGDARDIDAPMDTVTTKDKLALVTVWIKGEPWVIVDIKLRMLNPRELYRAQGFPDSYVIDRGHDGQPLTKSDQVHMCGNSVSPNPMTAIAKANDPWRVNQHVAA